MPVPKERLAPPDWTQPENKAPCLCPPPPDWTQPENKAPCLCPPPPDWTQPENKAPCLCPPPPDWTQPEDKNWRNKVSAPPPPTQNGTPSIQNEFNWKTKINLTTVNSVSAPRPPLYICTGWLGVNHQFTYLLTPPTANELNLKTRIEKPSLCPPPPPPTSNELHQKTGKQGSPGLTDGNEAGSKQPCPLAPHLLGEEVDSQGRHATEDGGQEDADVPDVQRNVQEVKKPVDGARGHHQPGVHLW